MSSRGSNNGGGGGVQSIPPASRKMVQSLKEIVNCPEAEIYATLKDCHMDPNEAVNRLLSQDPFHEVKSKREKKKETKDSTDSRSRGGINTSNRGARSGMDRYIGRGGSTPFAPSDSGALHVKSSYKKENGTNPYTSSSSTAHGTFHHPPASSDSVTNENKSSRVSLADGNVSASQPSTGYQPAWVGRPGQKSMADIVKMGRPQIKASSTPVSSHYGGKHHLAHAPPSTESYHGVPISEDHGSKVQDLYTEPLAAPDEWPMIEPPHASMSTILESRTDLQRCPDRSNLPSDEINQPLHSENDEDEDEEDSSVENLDHIASATVSSRNVQEDNSGDASLFDNDMYKDMASYQSHNHAFQSEEVEDVGASVSTETANMRQLSIQEDHEASYVEDVPSVVIPNHLQVQSADCSHLSFGSFGTSLGTGYSDPFTSRLPRSNMEEAPSDTDAPVHGHSDTRSSEYYVDESAIRTAADGNLGHRTGGGAAVFDSPSAPQAEVLKQENSEVTHGNQYAFPSSSPGYTFENAQQLNAAFNYSQTSSQMQNLTPYSSSMASLPSSLLAANVHPVREAELPYSPFLMSQSMPNKYGNTVSSIGGSSISVAEALKTGFQSVQSTQQNLPGTGVPTAPVLPQHLAMNPYSQPTLPLGPFANMITYPYMPQSYTYMPSGFQQAFAGNSTYHQSLAAVLPQYKNSVSVSNLPQSAAVPSGYGALGSSTTIPVNYAMNPPAASQAGSTIGYDDVLCSQYKDSNHLISLQQNDNSAMWLHGHGSRTIPAVPANTYYNIQEQNQQPGGFRQSQQPTQNYGNLGYPNFYHSQAGMSLEHQPQNPRDGVLSGSQGLPKLSQQIWQNGY